MHVLDHFGNAKFSWSMASKWLRNPPKKHRTLREWDYSLHKRDILAMLGGAPLLCVSCGLSISDLRQSHQSGSRIIQHQYPVPPLRIIHFHLSMCKINGNILLETYSKYTQPNNKHMHIYIHRIMNLENLSYKYIATYIWYIIWYMIQEIYTQLHMPTLDLLGCGSKVTAVPGEHHGRVEDFSNKTWGTNKLEK